MERWVPWVPWVPSALLVLKDCKGLLELLDVMAEMDKMVHGALAANRALKDYLVLWDFREEMVTMVLKDQLDLLVWLELKDQLVNLAEMGYPEKMEQWVLKDHKVIQGPKDQPARWVETGYLEKLEQLVLQVLLGQWARLALEVYQELKVLAVPLVQQDLKDQLDH